MPRAVLLTRNAASFFFSGVGGGGVVCDER